MSTGRDAPCPDTRRTLTEVEAGALLAGYGIPVCPSRLVRSAAELDGALAAVEPPWALKIVSPDILHKSDVGGVILDVRSPDRAREAYRGLLDRDDRDGDGGHP